MCFDFRLRELMHEHRIDRHAPWFYESLQAEKLIKKMWVDNGSWKRIIVLSDSKGDFEHFRVLAPEQKNLISVIYDNSSIRSIEAVKSQVEELEKADIIVLVSFSDHVRIHCELNRLGISVVDLYDYFVEEGLIIQHPFYGPSYTVNFDLYGRLTHDSWDYSGYGELFYCKEKVNNSSGKIRRFYYESLIFLLYNIRDFSNGKEAVKAYCREYEDSDCIEYKRFLEAVNTLLDEIKQAASSKENRSIIMYWIDAFSFDEIGSMPYLDGLSSSVTSFENVYAVTDTTSGEMNAIFLRKFPYETAEGRVEINGSSSDVISKLEDLGYDFKYYGIKGLFGEKYIENCRKEHIYTVSSEIYWNAICDILSSQRKCLYLIHVLGCHVPFLSGNLNCEEYLPYHSFNPFLDKETGELVVKQRPFAMIYEDSQIRFFDGLINNRRFDKVFFSDHGSHSHFPTNLAALYHIMLMIKSEKISKGIEKRVFSTCRLGELLCYLAGDDSQSYDGLFSETASLQSLPYYNIKLIRQVYKKGVFNELFMLGFNGVADGHYCYFRTNYGLELCYDMRSNVPVLMGKRKNEPIIASLRDRAHETDKEFLSLPKFRYSTILFDLFDRAYRSHALESEQERCVLFCRNLVEECVCKEIAIRGGGEDTTMFLDCLNEGERSRIKYIIDNNKECSAKSWAIPVVRLDEIDKNEKLFVLVISSRFHLEMMDEIEQYADWDVIDIYSRLSEKGFSKELFLSDILYKKRIVYRDEDFIPIDWESEELR